MKRLSLRLFALGFAIGALAAAAVPATTAYARTSSAGPQIRQDQSGQPVIDWNQALLSIVNTPGAQPSNIQPTRNFAVLHAAIYDAVNAIDRTHEPYLISVRAPRSASETAAADAAQTRLSSGSIRSSKASSTAATRPSSCKNRARYAGPIRPFASA